MILVSSPRSFVTLVYHDGWVGRDIGMVRILYVVFVIFNDILSVLKVDWQPNSSSFDDIKFGNSSNLSAPSVQPEEEFMS